MLKPLRDIQSAVSAKAPAFNRTPALLFIGQSAGSEWQ